MKYIFPIDVIIFSRALLALPGNGAFASTGLHFLAMILVYEKKFVVRYTKK